MSRYAAQLDWIDAQQERMVRLVSEWAGINSGTHHPAGLGRCAAAVTRELDRLGGDVRTVELPPLHSIDDAGRETTQPLGQLIRVTKHPDAAVRILVGIHYDTVYGEADPFQRVERIDANTLRGPGVADAKGGIVVMLAALEALERSPFAGRVGWDLFLNPDEEIGSPGSAATIAEMARGKAAALLFEPCLADGSLVGERKGSGNYTAVVTGRSAHAGRDPERGRNAIHALADFIAAAAALNDPARGTTVNVGVIRGGTATNVVPDLAMCRFNVRVNSAEEQRRVEERLRELADAINARDGLSLRLHGGFTALPKPLDDPTRRLLETVAACGRELGLSIGWKPSGGVCDGNRIAAAGVPTVDTLGPRGGELHSPREYLVVDSLAERAKLATMVMMKMATDGID